MVTEKGRVARRIKIPLKRDSLKRGKHFPEPRVRQGLKGRGFRTADKDESGPPMRGRRSPKG